MKTFRHIRGEAPFSGKGVVSYTPPLGVFLIVQNMKQIPLTQGQFALVDDEDYDELMKYKWSASKRVYQCRNHYYAIRNLTGIYPKHGREYMHRFLLRDGLMDGFEIDHIDGNGLNNQRSNLRLSTRSQNNMNHVKRSGSLTKYKGVALNKRDNNYVVCLTFDKKAIRLGRYKTEIEAAKAYDEAAIKYFGEFAKTNF